MRGHSKTSSQTGRDNDMVGGLPTAEAGGSFDAPARLCDFEADPFKPC